MTHVKKYLKKKKKKRTLKDNQKKKVLGEDTGEVSRLLHWSAEESDASYTNCGTGCSYFNTQTCVSQDVPALTRQEMRTSNGSLILLRVVSSLLRRKVNPGREHAQGSRQVPGALQGLMNFH